MEVIFISIRCYLFHGDAVFAGRLLLLMERNHAEQCAFDTGNGCLSALSGPIWVEFGVHGVYQWTVFACGWGEGDKGCSLCSFCRIIARCLFFVVDVKYLLSGWCTAKLSAGWQHSSGGDGRVNDNDVDDDDARMMMCSKCSSRDTHPLGCLLSRCRWIFDCAIANG